MPERRISVAQEGSIRGSVSARTPADRSPMKSPVDDRPKMRFEGRARRRVEGGFTLVDWAIGTSILVIAMLGLVASMLSQHNLSRQVEERSVAFETLGRFVERLRADADWGGLYARLAPLSNEGAADATLSSLAVDTSLVTRPAADYYADFTVPKSLGTVTFLVQVPVKTVGGVPALREDEVAPRYDLPWDLNGDGVVDGGARDADYRALPIVVRIRWQHPKEATQEAILSTCLRGDR